MRIKWHQNPLRQTIVFTPEEREVFLLKAKLSFARDMASTAAVLLDPEKLQNKPERAGRALSYIKTAINDEMLDEFANDALGELERGFHCGDCTCVPATCSRCLAEDILGINTTEGLGKKAGHAIQGAFGFDGHVTIEAALDSLKNFSATKTEVWSTYTEAEFSKLVAGWKADANTAYDWLLAYRSRKPPQL